MVTWWLTGIDPSYVNQEAKETVNEDINQNSVISVRESKTKLYNDTESVSNMEPLPAVVHDANIRNGGIPPPAKYSKGIIVTNQNGIHTDTNSQNAVKLGKKIEFTDTLPGDILFTPVEAPESGEKCAVDTECNRAKLSEHLVDLSDTDIITQTDSKIS